MEITADTTIEAGPCLYPETGTAKPMDAYANDVTPASVNPKQFFEARSWCAVCGKETTNGRTCCCFAGAAPGMSITPAPESPNPNNYRHLKIVSIDPDLILTILNTGNNPHEFVALPICPEIPEGTHVVAVKANWERRCIDAVIEHPSFPIPSPGETIPRLHGEKKYLENKILRRIPSGYAEYETVDIAFEKQKSDREKKAAELAERCDIALRVGTPIDFFLREILEFLKSVAGT